MKRQFTFHLDGCKSFFEGLENGAIFKEIGCDFIEEYGFDIPPSSELKLPDNFPNCCEYHKSLKIRLDDWFKKFPDCCEEHRKISLRKWFDKEKYKNIPTKIFNHLINTEDFISKSINLDNWYEEIIDYIEYNLDSFGIPNIGGAIYWSNLKFYIQNSDGNNEGLTKQKKRQLLEYFEIKEKIKPSEGRSIDLNILASTFQKWQKTFPDLVFFQSIKRELDNKFPLELVLYEPKHNKYLGTTKYNIKTQTELIEILIKMTKNLLASIDTTKLQNENQLAEKDKFVIDLISAKHKITQDKLLRDFNTNEIKYVKIIKRWLKNETNYLQELTTKLPPMIINSKNTTVYNNETGNQVINHGNMNGVVIGNNNNVELNNETLSSIEEVLNSLQQEIKSMQSPNKVDIENEIERVKSQLQNEQPKFSIIKMGLNLIYELLIEVTGAGISPLILSKLSDWIK